MQLCKTYLSISPIKVVVQKQDFDGFLRGSCLNGQVVPKTPEKF